MDYFSSALLADTHFYQYLETLLKSITTGPHISAYLATRHTVPDSLVNRRKHLWFEHHNFSFNKAENKKQFQHEPRVLITLQHSALAVADTERNIKLNIKLADKSQYGWATVKEKELEELASNSEDEKRRGEKRVKQWNSKMV
mgnify:CR=1 FL=1